MINLRLVASFISILVFLSQASPEVIHFWYWEGTYQTMMEVPITSINTQFSIINPSHSDNNTENCFEFSNQKIALHRCGQNNNDVGWQSPENWNVTDAITTDLNRDGLDEIALVVWRPFAPWPIDKFLPHGGRITEFHNKAGMSAHLILVGWDGDEYRELWAGSALANPISAIRAIDIDRDGYEELVAIEGDYDSAVEAGNITIWQWQGFGFTLIDRIEGKYSGYEVYRTDQQTSILTY